MHAVEEWIAVVGGWYATYGYALVFGGAFAENTALLGLLLPGGTLAALGAFYARAGTLNLAWVILLAWAGMVLGYHVDYLVGRFALQRVIGYWSARPLGRRLRIAGRVRLARAFLAKHGGKAIVLSHTAGHLRSFVALTAGAAHMPYPRFLAFELLAALIWSSAFCIVGYLIGTQLDTFLTILERVGWASLVALGVAALGWYIWRAGRTTKRRQHRGMRRSATSEVDSIPPQ